MSWNFFVLVKLIKVFFFFLYIFSIVLLHCFYQYYMVNKDDDIFHENGSVQ